MKPIQDNLDSLCLLLEQISTEQYTSKISSLSNATIGQHIRHILEFYQCLFSGIQEGVVNYDNRSRNLRIETNIPFAIQITQEIISNIKDLKTDKPILLQTSFQHNDKLHQFESTIYRELYYCFEHCIHHQALIKVALMEMEITQMVEQNFGVAPSTIKYQATCAQ
jgi:uncharacterized damage-inducible protein DinB